MDWRGVGITLISTILCFGSVSQVTRLSFGGSGGRFFLPACARAFEGKKWSCRSFGESFYTFAITANPICSVDAERMRPIPKYWHQVTDSPSFPFPVSITPCSLSAGVQLSGDPGIRQTPTSSIPVKGKRTAGISYLALIPIRTVSYLVVRLGGWLSLPAFSRHPSKFLEQ